MRRWSPALVLFGGLLFFALPVCADCDDDWGCGADQPAEECGTIGDSDPAPARGMTTCTSNQGCLACGIDVQTQLMLCVELPMENGECTCKTTRGPGRGVSGCVTEGACTYRR
jgi:hypothetical protein